MIKRSLEIATCITQGDEITSNPEVFPFENLEAMAEKFMKIDLDDDEEIHRLLSCINEIEVEE